MKLQNFFYSLFLLLCLTQLSQSQTVYHFNGKGVGAGTKQSFLVPISSGNDSTFIPITVFNGARKGKTLGITAGVHGYEYAPILAAQKLIHSLDPSRLTGVVILVQIANLESFIARSPFVNPVDKKNLNRSFPGLKGGTLTDRIAAYITSEVISKSDYFLDMHSGDAPEDLLSYSAYYSNSGFPESSKAGKEMARALGFEYMVEFNTEGKKYMDEYQASLYCSAEAFKRNIPAIDIECGRLGMVEDYAVNRIEKGVLNLLEHLNFSAKQGDTSHSIQPKEIKSRIYASAKKSGIFYPSQKAGDHVEKGSLLGFSTDYFGLVTERFYAQEKGIILMIIKTPAINEGEDVIVIGTL